MHLFASVISGQFICTASVVSTHCICSQYTLLLSPDSDWAWPYGVCMALSVWVWLWMAADCIMVGLGLGRVCLGVPCHLGRDPSDFCPLSSGTWPFRLLSPTQLCSSLLWRSPFQEPLVGRSGQKNSTQFYHFVTRSWISRPWHRHVNPPPQKWPSIWQKVSSSMSGCDLLVPVCLVVICAQEGLRKKRFLSE